MQTANYQQVLPGAWLPLAPHIFFFLIVVMPFPPNSPTLSGSLTTLLIAHLATLELGDHLESYVALTGLLRLHSRHFFIKLTFLVSTHFSSGQHALYKLNHSSATLEDVPPLVFATLGGFLQQLFGARRLLQASAVPAVLTWAVVVANPNSSSCILASR